jgi:hypothetical protein
MGLPITHYKHCYGSPFPFLYLVVSFCHRCNQSSYNPRRSISRGVMITHFLQITILLDDAPLEIMTIPYCSMYMKVCAQLEAAWKRRTLLIAGLGLRRYQGSERCMLIPNTLFRVGGAAILLTNKLSDRHRVKYELEHVVRVHLGSDDMAYG